MKPESGIIPENIISRDRKGIPEAINLVEQTVANGGEIVAAALSDEGGL